MIKKLTGKDVKGNSCGLTHILPQHFVQTEENHKLQSTGLDPRLKSETRAL
jgi:hypothetical protein